MTKGECEQTMRTAILAAVALVATSYQSHSQMLMGAGIQQWLLLS